MTLRGKLEMPNRLHSFSKTENERFSLDIAAPPRSKDTTADYKAY